MHHADVAVVVMLCVCYAASCCCCCGGFEGVWTKRMMWAWSVPLHPTDDKTAVAASAAVVVFVSQLQVVSVTMGGGHGSPSNQPLPLLVPVAVASQGQGCYELTCCYHRKHVYSYNCCCCGVRSGSRDSRLGSGLGLTRGPDAPVNITQWEVKYTS